MSKNGGFLDVRYDDLISSRGFSLCPHPRQMTLEGVSITPQGTGFTLAPLVQEHTCSCWQCHPEEIPEESEEAIGIRDSIEVMKARTRFWKTTLDGQPCGFVKEAKPGQHGYVWCARTPIHACSCESGYACTTVLHGTVTIQPDDEARP